MKVIVISGGSDGIGKAIAKKLSKDNKVIILARNQERLNQAAEEIGCDKRVCDVSDWQQVEQTIESITEEYGHINALVNNAGAWIEGPLEQNNPEEIEQTIKINVLGVIFLSKAVVPIMQTQKSGWIINIDSQAGIYAKAEKSVYHASKWAVTGFTKSLQQELRSLGIKVNALYPGKVDTDLFNKAGNEKSMNDALNPEDIAKTVEFMLSFDNGTHFPEIGIKNIED